MANKKYNFDEWMQKVETFLRQYRNDNTLSSKINYFDLFQKGLTPNQAGRLTLKEVKKCQ